MSQNFVASPWTVIQYGRDRQIPTGLYQGSLLLSTQGQLRKLGSQAAQWCLIMKSKQGQCWMVCQHHPVPVYFSLVREDVLFLAGHPLRVMAYTVPRSTVQTVTRTAGIQFSRCGEGLITLSTPYHNFQSLKATSLFKKCNLRFFYKDVVRNFWPSQPSTTTFTASNRTYFFKKFNPRLFYKSTVRGFCSSQPFIAD